MAILTEVQVAEIRLKWKNRDRSRRQQHTKNLAAEYGVTMSAIGHVIYNHNWKNVSDSQPSTQPSRR
jgi:hypothetical protein